MDVICIIGPTACGKKEIATALLDEFGEKITFISCDSRKIYRYMDIGTAKPPPSLRQYFRLMDIRNPDETYSAGDFAKDAEVILQEVYSKAKVPVIIGGTPLYYLALFSEFFEEPKKDPEIRRYVLEKLKKFGSETLYRELMEIDEETASKLHPNDWIRITRALEIYYQLKIPPSVARKTLKKERRFRPIYFGINIPRELLYQKIEARTLKMFHEGLVEETEKILQMGYSRELPSLNTIGYKESIAYLEKKISLEEAIRKTVKNTKVYARRQLRFFRSFNNVVWFYLPEQEKLLLDRLKAEIKSKLEGSDINIA
ncbi:MAG: tRNA (adenosine(37)-N6)-dimethylallyltransferase MiaA [Candidatus Hydrothermia bacterium]